MKTIVMTGGTAGLGRAAAQQIFDTPDMRLLVGARGTAQAEFETLPLDLSRLTSVRAFAQMVSDKLGTTQIDVLVLNAGVQFSDIDQRTEDGFETTFAVNHLAHYQLLRLLLPKLAKNATVVITTSDTHDPAMNPMGPKELDVERLARPQSESGRKQRPFAAGFRAYSSSKLCNLLTASALAASPDAQALGLRVIAYNPGLTPDTSLFRGWPTWIRLIMSLVRVLRPIFRLSTTAQAGKALADLALGKIVPPAGKIYASLVRYRVTWPEPSALARRGDVMNLLWRDSARMTGLPELV